MSIQSLLSILKLKKVNFRIHFVRIMQVFMIFAMLVSASGANPVSAAPPVVVSTASGEDPIPGYLTQVSLNNLNTVVNKLVTDYGPRHSAYNRPYIDDQCTLSSADPYPKNNFEMAADYAASLFTAMGYTVQREAVTLAAGPWTGHNIIVTKTGSLYPNDYIEVGAHLDSQPTTPGAGDDASGSSAVIELARVLKDYPSRYSIRFILYVGHEHGRYNEGSMYHLDQVQARGERIKAGLMIDSIGWSEIEPLYTTNLWVNDLSTDPGTAHIVDTFFAVQSQYGIPSVVRPANARYSENQSYLDHGMPAVLSVGGTPYHAPGYHGTSSDGGCSDTLDKLNRQNIFLSTQLNLGALIKLDEEVQPAPSLPVVAAVGSSAYAASDAVGNFAMRAFDGSRLTFWSIASDNFGYTDKWLTADLGTPKLINRLELDFGDLNSAIATDFQVWVGNEPTFTPGSYQVAANITDNSSNHLVLDIDPAPTGRWVRYMVTRVAGAASYTDYSLREMRMYGDDLPVTETRHMAVAATAKSYDVNREPIKAFDGLYNNFWHPIMGSSLPTPSEPQWVQADLGSTQVISRVVTYYNGGFALVEDCTKARDFQIWIGDDPTFATGSYTVAATVTNNDSNVVQVNFPEASGRYLRYVVTQVKGTNSIHFWDAIMYDLDIWGPSSGVPAANNLAVNTLMNTPVNVTLLAADPDNNPLTYSIVQTPAHGNVTGTAPALTYTPASNYTGADSFTYQANDGTSNSNIATVNITVIPPQPLPVIAAVASSTEVNSDPLLKRPMNAFNGNPDSYWTIANGNFGYADKWLQADLGSTKSLTSVVLNWGIWSRPEKGKEALAKDFQVWIGDDPTFRSGSYTVAANITNFTDPDNDGILTLSFDAPINGRWVRYVVTSATGTMYWDYALGEMQIYGSNVTAAGLKLQAVSATAKSFWGTLVPSLAFDGRYDNFWHVAENTPSPWWLQADLGRSQTLDRVITNYNGGYALVLDGTKARDFQIWVGDDPNFTAGSYTVAATITGNDSWYTLTDFPAVTGRYVRYVVSATKGTDFWDPIMYEMEIWQMTAPNTAPVTVDDNYTTSENATLIASIPGVLYNDTDADNDSLTATKVTDPAHGTLDLSLDGSFIYTPNYGYSGNDTFTYKASDGIENSNTSTVSINVTPNEYVLIIQNGHGTVTRSPEQVTYHYLDVVTLSMTDVDPGWSFTGWSGNVTDNKVTILGNTSVTANFAIDTFTLNYTAGTGGTVNGSASQIVNYGEDGIAVTAVANTGYHFVSWSDGVLTATRTDQNIKANLTVTANFAIDTFTLNYTAGTGGTVNGIASQTVNYDEDGAAVTAVANTGYHFVSWSDGILTATRTDQNIKANLAVTANFAIDAFTLAYTAGTGGTVNGSASQTVNYGEDGTAVTAVANTGYHFVSWSDGILTATRTDQNIKANLAVTANFAIDTFTLAYTAGTGGAINGSASQTVNYDEDGTAVTAVAKTGYHFVSWSDGVLTAARTDQNIKANLAVTANFTRNTNNRPPVANAGGPYSGKEGSIISLSASKSTDPDNRIVLYEWDLDNDGLFDDATGKKANFVAIDNGSFTVRVRVTDEGGLSNVDSTKVTIKNVAPVITSLSVDDTVRTGTNINARATFKDPGINDTFTAFWKWGDGSTSTGTVNDKTVNGSHTYTRPGIYFVTITVKDKDGGIAQTSRIILVFPRR